MNNHCVFVLNIQAKHILCSRSITENDLKHSAELQKIYDFNGIVLHLLRGLVKGTLQFEEIVTSTTSNLSHVDVKVEELQSRV